MMLGRQILRRTGWVRGATSSSTRAYGSKEPPHYVQFETEGEEVSTSQVGFHALTDRVKLEMYALNQSDPAANTYHVVAERYGVSKARAKAVLYLMELRDAKQKELLGADSGVLSDASAGLKDWMKFLERYREASAWVAPVVEAIPAGDVGDADEAEAAPTAAADDDDEASEGVVPSSSADVDANAETAVAAVEVEEDPTLVLLEELKVAGKVAATCTREQLGARMASVQEHLSRLGDVAAHEAKLASVMQVVSEAGYSTTFKEIEGAKGKTSLEDSYYPDLFGDREERNAVRRLQRRIAEDTKASVEVDTDISAVLVGELLGDEEGSPAGLLGPSPPLEKTAVATLLGEEPTTVSGEIMAQNMARWKFAFKDLSRPNAPTMIRTRGGGWRKANALEEINRSWMNKKPARIDMEYHRELVGKFLDPDGDEATAQDKVVQKHARRKAMLAAGKADDSE